MVEALEIKPTVKNADYFCNSRSEFAERLYGALGVDPNNLGQALLRLFPRKTFKSVKNMHGKSIELFEKIAENWQNPNINSHYKPSPNDLLQGLTDFAVLATQILHQALPKVPRVDIEVAMIVVGTRIKGLVIDSEGRRRNTRTEREIFSNLYRRKLEGWAREDSNL